MWPPLAGSWSSGARNKDMECGFLKLVVNESLSRRMRSRKNRGSGTNTCALDILGDREDKPGKQIVK